MPLIKPVKKGNKGAKGKLGQTINETENVSHSDDDSPVTDKNLTENSSLSQFNEKNAPVHRE